MQKKKEKLKKKEKKIIKFASEDVQDSDSDISSPLCGGGTTTTIPKQRKRGRPRKDVVNISATGTGKVVAKVAKPATNLNR